MNVILLCKFVCVPWTCVFHEAEVPWKLQHHSEGICWPKLHLVESIKRPNLSSILRIALFFSGELLALLNEFELQPCGSIHAIEGSLLNLALSSTRPRERKRLDWSDWLSQSHERRRDRKRKTKINMTGMLDACSAQSLKRNGWNLKLVGLGRGILHSQRHLDRDPCPEPPTSAQLSATHEAFSAQFWANKPGEIQEVKSLLENAGSPASLQSNFKENSSPLKNSLCWYSLRTI